MKRGSHPPRTFGVPCSIYLETDGTAPNLREVVSPDFDILMIIRNFFLIGVVIVLLPAKAWALDHGLNPRHDYDLWTNINQAVLTVGNLTGDDGRLLAELQVMKADSFAGKTPRDVLVLALEFESEFDKLRVYSGLTPTRQMDIAHKNTTPSDVFLVSSRVLFSVVEWIIDNTDSGHLVTQYFPRHSFKDKTPSDVFGLVDLAHRCIQVILENSSKMSSG